MAKGPTNEFPLKANEQSAYVQMGTICVIKNKYTGFINPSH